MPQAFVRNLFFAILLLPFSMALANTQIPIGEFHEISPGLSRGARPTAEGLRFLASQGVKTILNLDNDSKSVQWEIKEAQKLGIRVISHPMSGFWKPKTEQVNASLAVLADESLHPVFVHCQYGQDRTGLITGLFRVEFEGWSPKVAYDEMLENGFHQSLVFLDYYYSKRTGYRPPPVHNDDPIYRY